MTMTALVWESRRGAAKRTFTLIEILAVIAVIFVLVAIAIGGASLAGRKMDDARGRAILERLTTALEVYKEEHGYYPRTVQTWHCNNYRSPSRSGGPYYLLPQQVVRDQLGIPDGDVEYRRILLGGGFGDPKRLCLYDPSTLTREQIANYDPRYVVTYALADGFGGLVYYHSGTDAVHNEGAFDIWTSGPDGPPGPFGDDNSGHDTVNTVDPDALCNWRRP